MENKKTHFTKLDGSLEQEIKTLNEFTSNLTKGEHERAMSSEFDYLEED